MKTIKNSTLLVIAMMLFTFVAQAKQPKPKLHLDFKQVENAMIKDVTGNGYNGVLKNNASIRKIGKYNVLDLGASNGYLDFERRVGELVASLEDFTISTYLYIGQEADLSKHGNFVWAFSTKEDCKATTGEYVAYKVNMQRYEQSTGGWENEVVGVQTGKPAVKGKWQHIAYIQAKGVGTLYVDGEAVATDKASIQPKDMTAAPGFNWLGRAPFKPDVYLKHTLYHEFQIYDVALPLKDLKKKADKLSGLNDSMQ